MSHCRCGGMVSDFIARAILHLGEGQVSFKQLKKLQQVVTSAKAGPPGACVCHLLPVGPTTLKGLTRRFAAAVAAGATGVAGGLEVLKGVIDAGVESRRPRPPAGFYPGTKLWQLTAQHESGHAVFACLAGLPLREGIVGDKAAQEEALGFVRFSLPAISIDRATSERQKAEIVAVYLAGAACEKWHGAFEPDLRGTDLKAAKRLFKELAGRKPDAHALGCMVRDLSSVFTDAWVGKATQRVANLLAGTCGGVTTGEAIEREVRSACGPFFDLTSRLLRSKAASVVLAHVEHAKSILECERKALCPS